jgi:hypothetical protein
MPRRKVIISYVHFATEELIALTWFILSKMTGNGYFTTPDPTLAEVKNDLEDLETKNTAAMEGGRTAHAQMMEARIKLLETLRSLGLYVEKIAKGNLSIMLSSGFPVSSVPHPKDRPDFWATYGTNSGDILLGCKTFPRAKAYVWQCFVGDAPPTNEKQWIWFMVTTKAHTEISGLIRGGVVWFRCCAVTPDGMQSWKDAISIMVV